MTEKKTSRFTIANTNSSGTSNRREDKSSLGGNKPTSTSQRVISLLSEVNTRLRRDEQDREKLWREIDATRNAIADLEDKSEQTAKVFLNLEARIARSNSQDPQLERWKLLMEDNQKALHTQIEKAQNLHSSLIERVESAETTAGSAMVKMDEVVVEQQKLGRRIEAFSDEKMRLLRKMEGLEEALIQTQDTLRAKALVLLTDQAVARKTDLPTTPATVKGTEALTSFTATEKTTDSSDFPDEDKDEFESLTHPARQAKNDNRKQGWLVAASIAVLLATAAGAGVWYMNSIDNELPFNVSNTSFTEATDTNTEIIQAQNTIDDLETTQNADSFNSMDTMRSRDDAVLAGLQDSLSEEEAITMPSMGTSEDMMTETNTANESITVTPLTGRNFQAEEKAAVDEFLSTRPTTEVAERFTRNPNLPDVVKQIENQAFDGSGAAQHDLAAIYTAGHAGVEGSYETAAKWFEEASYNGIANARYNLGVLYQQGLGVPKDETKAVQLYKAASYLQHPEAQYNLGIAYIEGVGVDHDIRHAAYYFERAADNNVTEAAYNLGLIHENGLMGTSEPDEALFWYSVAANKGNPEAIKALDELSSKMGLTKEDVNILVKRMSVLKPDTNIAITSDAGQTEKNTTVSASNVDTTESQIATSSTEVNANSRMNEAITETSTVQNGSGFAPGSRAVIVSQIQEQLMRLGLYPGPADGINGPLTEDAVMSYQKAENLTVNGRANEDLLVHMLAKEFELDANPIEYGSSN
ncbi:MAG: hypothetical protein CL565_04390 [Alphaproteobacteria bacterium]|nr:hypothetical protein [Alphaproteobacteria bacterium]